jgi:hypothetical protein
MWNPSLRALRLRSATLRPIGPVRGERSPEGEVEAGTALFIHKSIRKTVYRIVQTRRKQLFFQGFLFFEMACCLLWRIMKSNWNGRRSDKASG